MSGDTHYWIVTVGCLKVKALNVRMQWTVWENWRESVVCLEIAEVLQDPPTLPCPLHRYLPKVYSKAGETLVLWGKFDRWTAKALPPNQLMNSRAEACFHLLIHTLRHLPLPHIWHPICCQMWGQVGMVWRRQPHGPLLNPGASTPLLQAPLQVILHQAIEYAYDIKPQQNNAT